MNQGVDMKEIIDTFLCPKYKMNTELKQISEHYIKWEIKLKLFGPSFQL